MRDLMEKRGACVIMSMTGICLGVFGGERTSCREESVIFLITPRLQLVRVVGGRKVLFGVIAREEKRAEPNGFVVFVVFRDAEVGDSITTKQQLSAIGLSVEYFQGLLFKDRSY